MSIKDTKQTILNLWSAARGKSKRMQMVDKAVNREVKKQYPSGLSQSPQNIQIRKKIKRDLIKKLTRKNPKLLE